MMLCMDCPDTSEAKWSNLRCSTLYRNGYVSVFLLEVARKRAALLLSIVWLQVGSVGDASGRDVFWSRVRHFPTSKNFLGDTLILGNIENGCFVDFRVLAYLMVTSACWR